jgi:hypothetical protein
LAGQGIGVIGRLRALAALARVTLRRFLWLTVSAISDIELQFSVFRGISAGRTGAWPAHVVSLFVDFYD